MRFPALESRPATVTTEFGPEGPRRGTTAPMEDQVQPNTRDAPRFVDEELDVTLRDNGDDLWDEALSPREQAQRITMEYAC
jgi:hypothetical protein